jgi:hypothetical protein
MRSMQGWRRPADRIRGLSQTLAEIAALAWTNGTCARDPAALRYGHRLRTGHVRRMGEVERSVVTAASSAERPGSAPA